MNIAVVITAYNRREKTLNCLRNLYTNRHKDITFTVFLTDDASTDGTSEAVRAEFPDVIISLGTGNLYWSRGTNLSWKRAIEHGGFDGYLLLNDDTEMLPNYWDELINADNWCRKKFGIRGIYAGATISPDGSRMTYSASINTKKWRSLFKMLEPNGDYQLCETSCANIIFISDNVVSKIGIIHPKYLHGVGDYDYTMDAQKHGFPLILMPDYVGKCEYDHKSNRERLMKMNLIKRIRYIYSPTGLQLPHFYFFHRRFFPLYAPLIIISYWSKALFPKFLLK